MKNPVISLTLLLLTFALPALAQDSSSPPPPHPGAQYAGMYTFLREGEFVQITVEDAGNVTGFVSRYGDLDSDKGAFLDHFFKDGKLTGTQLTFKTETVHGTWFDFTGSFGRGEGKNPGDEAFYALKGTLVQHVTDETQKTITKTREVVLKSFPQKLTPTQGKAD
jgi:hypothetical protein